MSDRIIVQVQFKKFIWLCPKCGQEDIVDAKVGGGNEYVHTCSKCAAEFNQSGPNMKEYNGSINYTPTEYESLKAEDLATAKKSRCDKWLYDWKNPPEYVEPTKADLEAEKAQKQAEVDALQSRIDAKVDDGK